MSNITIITLNEMLTQMCQNIRQATLFYSAAAIGVFFLFTIITSLTYQKSVATNSKLWLFLALVSALLALLSFVTIILFLWPEAFVSELSVLYGTPIKGC